MRTHLCMLAALLVLGGTAAAQGRQIGFKVGASLSTLARERTLAGDEPFDRRAGMTIGPYILFPVAPRIGLQLEMLFTEKGGSLPLHDPFIISGTAVTRYRLSYLDVPVLGRVTGPRVRGASLVAFGGPTVSVRLSAQQQTAFEGFGSSGFERDVSGDVKRLDVGLTAGAGVQVGRVLVDARYTHGFSEAFEDLGGAALANRGVLMTVGVRIFQ